VQRARQHYATEVANAMGSAAKQSVYCKCPLRLTGNR
jgi:hypothetical protein